MSHFFHRPHRKTIRKHAGSFIDGLIYPIAIISPLMTAPQIYDVWINKNTSGVSVLTWGAYGLGSGLWAVYGAFHKEKPITIVNSFLFVLQMSVAIGVILYR